MRFFRKLFKTCGQPRVIITDKLRSYNAVKAELGPGFEHRLHKGLNNRAEASHRHTCRRAKIIGQFKSPSQAQRFLSVHDQAAVLFRPKRHRLLACSYRPPVIRPPPVGQSIRTKWLRDGAVRTLLRAYGNNLSKPLDAIESVQLSSARRGGSCNL